MSPKQKAEELKIRFNKDILIRYKSIYKDDRLEIANLCARLCAKQNLETSIRVNNPNEADFWIYVLDNL